MSLTLHINSLPDLVLRRIFSKVPLRDLLLNGRRVCPVWESYSIETCQQVHSLTLLLGSSDANQLITNSCFTLKYRDLLLNEDGTRMYSPQYLHEHFHLTNVDSFKPKFKFADQLVNTFPRITTLEIAIKVRQYKRDITQAVISLLTKWSPNLKSLKIYFHFEGRFTPSPLLTDVKTKEGECNILKVINSLSSLEHLTLYFNLNFIAYSSFDLPILGQLREFYLESHDHDYKIVDTLEQYAVANDNLEQIGIEMLSSYTSSVDPLFVLYRIKSISPTFYRKFPQLWDKVVYFSAPQSLNRNRMNRMENLKRDILSFTSITSFCMCLKMNENIFTGALNFLVSLEHLVHLELNFEFYYGDFCSLQFQDSPDQVAQLSSIHALTFSNFDFREYLAFKSKFESTSHAWAHLFPNVQVIELEPCNNSLLDVSQDSLDTFKDLPKLAHIRVYTKKYETTPSGRQVIRELILTRSL